MRFGKPFFVGTALIILLTSCTPAAPAKDMGYLYRLALDATMPIDEGLNEGIKYIAIDMSNFTTIQETDKNDILKYFEKYRVEVMEATYEQLRAKGLYNAQNMVLHGILLRVDKTEISTSQVVIEGSKYRSGDGAIGTKVTIRYKDGTWQVTRADMTWIS